VSTSSLRWVAPSLQRVDELYATTDVFVMCLCSDEAPLRGAAGFVDWRLCGALSRGMQGGKTGFGLGAKAAPELYTWHIWRKPVMVVGFGPGQQLKSTATSRFDDVASVIKRGGWKSVVVVPPQPPRSSSATHTEDIERACERSLQAITNLTMHAFHVEGADT
jgi:hypothetical protein